MSKLFDGVFFNPAQKYEFQNSRIDTPPTGLKIYEAHVGMSSIHGRVAQYREFADQVLPRIVALGYNCV
jgi:1,4-alpha-glucan branching enzyme